MKRKKIMFPVAALALILSMGVTACGKSGGQESGKEQESQQTDTSKVQEKITINAADNKTKLILGETVQLTASVEGVTWESKNADVAKVDEKGLVTSVGAGSTTITASKDGYKAGSISIKVELEKITVTAAGEKTSLLAGETVQLTASKEGVTWASSNTDVATVNEAGLVTGVKFGETTITASKDGFAAGNIVINVVRTEVTATLHWEDAEHYAADGWWAMSYYGTDYGPGASPIYARESGNASDGTCIAYSDEGDKETLKFSSNVAIGAELVLTMASRSEIADMSTVMNAKFNDVAIDLAGKSFAGGGDTNTFLEFSLGDVELKNGENVLALEFLASAPYLDDLAIYATGAATIEVIKAAEATEIEITSEKELSIVEGETSQIVSTVSELNYSSTNEAVATVSETGLITAVAKGTAKITVFKAGYKSVRLAVTVSEKVLEGEIKVEAETGTVNGEALGDATDIVIRSTSTGETCTAQWAEGAVLLVKFTAETAGNYTLSFVGRAGGQYGMTNIEDLSAAIEVKFNDAALTIEGAVSGRTFTNYVLADVEVKAGENTIEVKGLVADTAPNIDFFKLVPKA